MNNESKNIIAIERILSYCNKIKQFAGEFEILLMHSKQMMPTSTPAQCALSIELHR
jgi:uncharacterized protein YjfI (DUF2170 family)